MSLPNCHYQIVVTELSPYQIFITKLALPNCHYQIVITKNPPIINVFYLRDPWILEKQMNHIPTSWSLDFR